MQATRVIVQARTSSSRLPAKCLLPVAGYPMAILAALRVTDPGWDTVLATSDDPSDNQLARLSLMYGLTVMRGPLEDVLTRFYVATKDLPNRAIVVRLTADNLFPDALLVKEVVREFVHGQHEYLTTSSPFLDSPYGLAVEVFRVRSLRESVENGREHPDREHVTTRIRRRLGGTEYRPRSMPVGYGRLRCTIDTLHDYLRIAELFDRVTDPVNVPWIELCARLARASDTPCFKVPHRTHFGKTHGTLVLGTAQLGSRYGITNTVGLPTEEHARNIVYTALNHGVTHLDTARGYGESERRIGAALAAGYSPDQPHIVTKLNPLDDVDQNVSRKSLMNFVDKSVFHSCRELRLYKLPTVLVHRARDRTRWKGAAWKRLNELKDQGVIGTLGVSAETPAEALLALDDPEVRHLQIPFNILDRRWKEAAVDAAMNRRPDVTVHARSPLLQGILATSDPRFWPRLANLNPEALLARLNTIVSDLQRESLLDLSFAYVRSHPWIHGVVSGFETTDQLTEAVRLFNNPELNRDEIEYVESHRGLCTPDLLDPAKWPR